MDFSRLEKNIGYTFKNKDLVTQAFTHGSYSHEFETRSYERLEFLGDSILEFVTSEWLFKKYHDLKEGTMSKIRSASVCEDSLYDLAIKFEFPDFLLLGSSELSNFHITRKAILADCVEALIAAIYLDSGLDNAKKFITSNFKKIIEKNSHHVGNRDYKTAFQEVYQKHGPVKIKYTIIGESGPDHDKSFEAKLEVNGKIVSYGIGSSKKMAEMQAAKNALEIIQEKHRQSRRRRRNG